MKNLQIIETPDKTKTCPPSIPASMADFSPIMLSTCFMYRVSSGGGPSPLLGHFLMLLNAALLRFNSNHICFDIVHCAGNTAGCIESTCYICLLYLGLVWFVTVLECFGWRSILFSATQKYAVESLKKSLFLSAKFWRTLPPSWFQHSKNSLHSPTLLFFFFFFLPLWWKCNDFGEKAMQSQICVPALMQIN